MRCAPIRSAVARIVPTAFRGGYQMTAINLSYATFKDRDLFAEYTRQAVDLMRVSGVEVIAGGDFA